MKVLSALVILLPIVTLSVDGARDCCRKFSLSGKFFEERASIKTKKDGPICALNRFLCRKIKTPDVHDNVNALIELFDKWSMKYSGQDPAFEFLSLVISLAKMRRDSQLCNAKSLEIIIHGIPQFMRRWPSDNLEDSKRINKILIDLLEEHASECPEVAMDHFNFLRKTFNKSYKHYILGSLGKVIASQLGVEHKSKYTKDHYKLSGKMINLNSRPVAQKLIEGLKSIADEATLEYLVQQPREQKQQEKEEDDGQSTELVSYRSIANILRRYIVKPCSYFINHFKSLFPSLRIGDFEAFSRHLEPMGDNNAAYYHYWIMYDVCRQFNYQLQTYFNPITKFVVAEFNGYGHFQELQHRQDDFERILSYI